MYRLEFRDRLLVGAVVALGRERPLSYVDDEERGVEAAVFHLRKVDLGIEALGVVLLSGEVVGIDVGVRVECNYALVDGARLLDERGIRGGLRGRRRRRQDNRQHHQGGKGQKTGHGNSESYHPPPLAATARQPGKHAATAVYQACGY